MESEEDAGVDVESEEPDEAEDTSDKLLAVDGDSQERDADVDVEVLAMDEDSDGDAAAHSQNGDDCDSADSASIDDESLEAALQSVQEEALRCLSGQREKLEEAGSGWRSAQEHRRNQEAKRDDVQRAVRREEREARDLRQLLQEGRPQRREADLEEAKESLRKSKLEHERLSQQLEELQARARGLETVENFDAEEIRKAQQQTHLEEVKEALNEALPKLFSSDAVQCVQNVLRIRADKVFASSERSSPAALLLHVLMCAGAGTIDISSCLPVRRVAKKRAAAAAAVASPPPKRRQPVNPPPPPQHAKRRVQSPDASEESLESYYVEESEESEEADGDEESSVSRSQSSHATASPPRGGAMRTFD
eukprot:TRINITY_DN16485_c0_g1_i1.p1 TRINITY_DN16485_c0_g1~~TRINITY_DN16485_c0_g1_i1.p1  ORF type:complete len:414 (+),score=161.92 TRINITY_DN16485_c0_g1_i1:149-1243(+)